MKILEILEKWYDNTIKSFIMRTGAIVVIAFFSSWYLGYETDILNLSAITIYYVCLGILLAGFSTWGFTKLNFVKQGDTISLVNIFRAIMMVIAALIIAYYFKR